MVKWTQEKRTSFWNRMRETIHMRRWPRLYWVGLRALFVGNYGD